MSDVLYDPKFKGAIHLDPLMLWNKVRKSGGRLLKRILKERFDFEMCGMLFPRNHRLFEIFNKKLSELFESGLSSYWEKLFAKYLDPKFYHWLNNEEPQKLTMEQLESGFVIWLISLSFSCLVFICEWLIRLKDFLIIKFVLQAYCRKRQMDAHLGKLYVHLFSLSKDLEHKLVTIVEDKESTLNIALCTEV